MKLFAIKILCIFLFCSLFLEAKIIKKPAFEYRLKTSNVSLGYITVEIIVTSFPEQNKVRFEYNPDSMERFRITDLSGKRIKYKLNNGFLELDTKESSFEITYRAKTSSYYARKIGKKSELPNFVIEDSMILFGQNTFITPVFSSYMNLSPAIIVWLNFPDFWKFVSSLGVINSYKADNANFIVSDMRYLLNSVILAGNLEIEKTKINNKYYYLLFMGEWAGTKKRILSLYNHIAKKQINLWKFLPADFMIVAFLKDKNVDIGKGFQYTNTVVHLLPNQVDLRNINFLKLLAHEHFHLWNGAYLKPKESEIKSVTWFHEGVTDYYALMTLISAGLIEEDAFLDYILSKYIKYDTSPFSDVNEYHDFFIAMAIDLEIRKYSKYKKSLDDVLNNISVKSSFWDKGYINSDLKAEISKVANNWDVNDFFDLHILQNKKIDVKSFFEYLGLNITTKTTSKLVEGYNYSESKNIKKVTSVKKETSAYKAGLKVGDLITDIVVPKTTDKEMKISIKRGKFTQTIVFDPWEHDSKLIFETNRSKNKIYNKWLGR